MARSDFHERWHREEMERQAKRQADAAERQADAAERTARGDSEGDSNDANASCLAILIVAGLPVALGYFLIYKFVTSPTLWFPLGSALVVLVGLCALAIPASGFASRLLLCLGGAFFVLILFGLPAFIFAHEYNPDAKRPLKWVMGSLLTVIPVGICVRAWLGRTSTVQEQGRTPKLRVPRRKEPRREEEETDIIYKQWYVGDQSKSFGPYSINELMKFAHGGQLTPDTQVCGVGSSQWVRAGDEFPDLFESTSRSDAASTATTIVGQRIEFRGMEQGCFLRGTVTAVEEFGEIPGRKKRSLSKFLAVLMTVENLGKRSDSASTNSFKLKDSQGRIFDLIDDASELEERFNREGPYADVQPGIPEDLMFVFQVAKDSKEFVLVLPPEDEE